MELLPEVFFSNQVGWRVSYHAGGINGEYLNWSRLSSDTEGGDAGRARGKVDDERAKLRGDNEADSCVLIFGVCRV